MREYNFESNERELTDEQREQLDEQLARRVLEEVQHLEREEEEEREEDVDEQEQEQEQQNQNQTEEDEDEQSAEEGREKSRGERGGLFWMFISGNVLLWRGLTRYYGQMILVAFLFLISIVVMFWSLHLDMEYNHLSRSVQLLRERSVRLQEVRSSRLSHSAIVKELERRGIELHDPSTPATVIEKSSFWK